MPCVPGGLGDGLTHAGGAAQDAVEPSLGDHLDDGADAAALVADGRLSWRSTRRSRRTGRNRRLSSAAWRSVTNLAESTARTATGAICTAAIPPSDAASRAAVRIALRRAARRAQFV